MLESISPIEFNAPFPGDYDSLIEEAYIEPIRTVIVVDDEFPSLDGLIAKELNGSLPWKGQERDAKQAMDILTYCRTRPRPWLVDFHDGRKITISGEDKIAPYLHHSDLMILDFHLDGDHGTGDNAIRILRNLADNNHFNMVIVYTKGENKKIEPVLRQITLGLMLKEPSLSIEGRAKEIIENAISEWENDDPDIKSKLTDSISEKTYLDVRQNNNGSRSLLKSPEWSSIEELLSQYTGKKLENTLWAKWLIAEKQDDIAGQFSETSHGEVSWTWSENFNWIKTDKLFLTVVDKSNAPKDLPGKLMTAIKNWQPSPHQLLMARMRAQMDEHGIIAESRVLKDRFLQAGWMQKIFSGSCIDRKQTLKHTVDRHWESLGDNLRSDIDAYADKLATHLNAAGEAKTFERFFPSIDLQKDKSTILKRLNNHACMKSNFEHSHLMTGHIIELGKELWACLSPACDLVPGQKKTGWYGRLGNYLPFMAVHLQKVSDETALREANQNIFIFIKDEPHLGCYSFCPMGLANKNPQWEQFFAKNNGKFENQMGELIIGRLNDSETGLVFGENSAKIVGQLRYEYALNLLQRLGTNLSRVGLDYHANSSPD